VGKEIKRVGGGLVNDADDDLPRVGKLPEKDADLKEDRRAEESEGIS